MASFKHQGPNDDLFISMTIFFNFPMGDEWRVAKCDQSWVTDDGHLDK